MLKRPFPLEKTVQDFFNYCDKRQPVHSESRNNDYLEIIDGIARYFYRCMNADGSIIDPYANREIQYSTPAYAAATSLLFAERKQDWMLESAFNALKMSLQQMVEKKCADGHSHFYTTMVVFAYEQLEEHLLNKQRESLQCLFWQIDPQRLYSRTINNWKVVGIAGEWLRNSMGLGEALTLEQIDQQLQPQMELINEYGLYIDPNGPMAYAMFTRNYFKLMLSYQYTGKHMEKMAECCRRGDLTSLFMQSPTGEMPTGGRSAQHQWNEAQQAFQFECAAVEYSQKGDYMIAGAFKRAANLSLESIKRWIRPTGELYVVKNFADPMTRTGYEPYTNHSQYNLLTAYFLACAYAYGNDEIEKVPCPAEVGGFCLWIEPFFNKLILNAGGHYVEYQTRGEPNNNPTGIIRIQRKGIWPTIGPSDGTPNRSDCAISYAPAWRLNIANNKLVRLAEMTMEDLPYLDVNIESCERKKVEVSLYYRGTMDGVFLIKRRLILTPEILEVGDSITGEADELVEEMPLFAFDGQVATKICCSGKRLDMAYDEDKACVMSLDQEASDFMFSDCAIMSRNGMLTSAYYKTKQMTTNYIVHLYNSRSVIAETELIEKRKQ